MQIKTKKIEVKIVRETPLQDHTLFRLSYYTGEILKNGLFDLLFQFYVLGTMFL